LLINLNCTTSGRWFHYPFRVILGGNSHPTPEAPWGLLAVKPDGAEPLAVVALG